MKIYRIPKKNGDLRKYATWKNLKYLLCFLLYEAFGIFAFQFYLNRRYENAEPLSWWVYPLFAAAVLISGWMICCMSRFVTDRSFVGRISMTKVTRSYDRGLSRTAKLSIDEHSYLKISTVNRNGKRRRVRIQLFDDGYDGYYRDGGTLVKFRGLNYPLCLESEAEGVHLCGVCGVRTHYKDGKVIYGEAEPEKLGDLLVCRSCRHTLVDINDLI